MLLLLATDGSAMIEEKDSRKPGSWSAISSFTIGDKEVEMVSYGSAIGTTNNQMELSAVIFGLRALIRTGNKYFTLYKDFSVEVVTDSQYVFNAYNPHPKSTVDKGLWMTDWLKNNGNKADGKPVSNWDLWLELNKTIDKMTALGIDLKWSWVKGHQKGKDDDKLVSANKSVDKLCSELTSGLIKSLDEGSLYKGTGPTFYIKENGNIIFGPKGVSS